MQLDLREVGSGNGDIHQGNIVLQIQKVRNISTPKGNEESKAVPRMLKLSMTDGKNNFQALEVEHISALKLVQVVSLFLLVLNCFILLH